MLWKSCLLISLAACAVPANADPIMLGVGSQPRVVSDGKMQVAVVFGRPGEIVIADSADGGVTFGKPRILATEKGLMLGMRRGPRAASTAKTMVVTAIAGGGGQAQHKLVDVKGADHQHPAQRSESGGQDGRLWAWVSSDGGTTWSKSAKSLNSVAGSAREGLHGMASGPGGMVACVWLDMRNVAKDRPGTEVWMSLSDDGGLTWKDDRVVYRHLGGTVCECCHPSVAIDSNKNIHVMFRHAKDGARDMYLTSSHDAGRTFNEPQKLGTGTWPLNACPMDGGDLTIDPKGIALTAWMRAGRVFSASPGGDEKEFGKGRQPVVVVTANRSWNGWIDGSALMAQWTGGPSWQVAVGANYPTAAHAADGLVVAWEQKDEVCLDVIRPPNQ